MSVEALHRCPHRRQYDLNILIVVGGGESVVEECLRKEKDPLSQHLFLESHESLFVNGHDSSVVPHFLIGEVDLKLAC